MTNVPDSLSDSVEKAGAWHNFGNMYLSQKQYAQSIDSYKKALRNNPADMETKTNLAYAQKMLKEEENQDQNQDQDQHQDQDQNQDQDQDQNQDQEQKQQESPPAITPQAAQQMLEAVQQKERETQEKVQKEKAKAAIPVRSGKNW